MTSRLLIAAEALLEEDERDDVVDQTLKMVMTAKAPFLHELGDQDQKNKDGTADE
jgi:hypothetical protein